MPFEFSGVTSMITSWVINPFIWMVVLFIFVGVIFGFLVIRKKRKLIYQCLELVDYGDVDRKFGFNIIPAGWFGKKKFMKYFDYGEERLETKTGEIIYDFSTEDFQEINGKRGIVCFRDPVNQNILVPISKIKVTNKELLAEIAPAEFRDVALGIIKDADRETKDFKEKIMQVVLWGLVIAFSLIAIIIISQLIKHSVTETKEMVLSAGETCMSAAKEICSQVCSQMANPSTAP